MTAYSAIATGEDDAESPVTESYVGKLKNNPLAMFEGAVGAPSPLGAVAPWSLTGSVSITSATASADLVDVFNDSFEKYIILVRKMRPSSGGVSLHARLSNNSGSTWDSTTDYYQGSTAYNSMNVSSAMTNTAGYHGQGSWELANLRSATQRPVMSPLSEGQRWVTTTNSGAILTGTSVHGKSNTNGPWDSIQFYFSAGNVEEMEAFVIGLREA